jgi:phage terminase Nu1 subunit (DNA packaging protein)
MAPKIETLALTEIAAAFRKTTRTIQTWRREGMPTRNINGEPRFVLSDCIQWREERVASEAAERARGPATSLDKDAEMARKLSVEADLRTMDREERRRELVAASEYQERLETFLGGMSAVSAGQLQRFERDIVKAATPTDARKITQAIHTALMEAAQSYGDTLEAELAEMEAEAA